MALVAVWTEIPNTRTSDAFPSYMTASYAAGHMSGNIFGSESGGCFDPVRRIMYSALGGGHADSYFNMVFACHVPVGLTGSTGWKVHSHASRFLPEFAGGPNGGELPPLFASPSVPSVEVYSDGRPPARHTYCGIQVSPVQNHLWIFSGPVWKDAAGDNRVWLFPNANVAELPSTTKWVEGARGYSPPLSGFPAAYDRTTNITWGRDNANYITYDHTQNTWARQGGPLASVGGRKTAFVDHVRQVFYIIRQGDTWLRWITTDATIENPVGTTQNLTGDLAVFDEQSPGAVYLDGIDKYVVWAGLGTGGANLTIIDPETFVCTTIVATGDLPGADCAHGSYGRFAWAGPHEIILANTTGQNMYQLTIVDDAAPGTVGTAVDLVTSHALYVPPAAVNVAQYRYTITGVETKTFTAPQDRVTILDVPDDTGYTATAGAYDGTGTLIGTLRTSAPFDVPFPEVVSATVHSVISQLGYDVTVVVPALIDGAMIACFSARNTAQTITTFTFDGAAMTALAYIGAGTSGNTNGRVAAVYYMLAPPAKSGVVSVRTPLVTTGPSSGCIISVIFLEHVHQVTPFGTPATVANAAGSSASTIDVPSAVGDLILDVVTGGGFGQTTAAGQNLLYADATMLAGEIRQGASWRLGEATDTTMAWTFGPLTGISTCQAGVAVKLAVAPDPPSEADVPRVVSTAIAVTPVGPTDETVDITVTYASEDFVYTTPEVTLWQIQLLDVDFTVIETIENMTQAVDVAEPFSFARPDGFGSPYLIRARERHAETGVIINEHLSASFAVDPVAGPVSLLVPGVVTVTPIPAEGAPDGMRVSWTLVSEEFGQETNANAYTAIRVDVGALPPKMVMPTQQSVEFKRVRPGLVPIRVGRYRMDTDEWLQVVEITRRHGNREVNL